MTMQELLDADRTYRLRIADFRLLAEAGTFDGFAKAELIEGVIVTVNAQYRPHALLKMELYDRIRDALRGIDSPLRPLVEASVAISDHSIPDPDIVLTSEPRGEGPIPLASVALVVEISDTTLEGDLGLKAHLYAAAGIPEYWVADVNARVIHQLWAPGGEGYGQRREVAFGKRIEAATVKNLAIETTAF